MLGHDYPWPIVASHPHRWHPLLSSCSAQQKEQPSLKKVAAHRVFSWDLPGISWGSSKNGGISSMASQKKNHKWAFENYRTKWDTLYKFPGSHV